MHKKSILLLALLSLSACGTFSLGIVHPQIGKSADQQQLDILSCKDLAATEVNSASHQATDFLLGLTLIGTPFAYAQDQKTERTAFALCMRARGYSVVLPH